MNAEIIGICANGIAILSAIFAALSWAASRRIDRKWSRPLRVYSDSPDLASTVSRTLRSTGYKDVMMRPLAASHEEEAMPVLAVPEGYDAQEWAYKHQSPEYGVVYSPGRISLPSGWVGSNSIPISLPLWVGAAIAVRWGRS